MKWRVKEWLCESYKAEKENGLKAYIYKSALWAEFYLNRKTPGYDVRYKGQIIARIYFESKGAIVKTFDAAAAYPEISGRDLAEIAKRVNTLRFAGAQLN